MFRRVSENKLAHSNVQKSTNRSLHVSFLSILFRGASHAKQAKQSIAHAWLISLLLCSSSAWAWKHLTTNYLSLAHIWSFVIVISLVWLGSWNLQFKFEISSLGLSSWNFELSSLSLGLWCSKKTKVERKKLYICTKILNLHPFNGISQH